jgi:hypothetical protein
LIFLSPETIYFICNNYFLCAYIGIKGREYEVYLHQLPAVCKKHNKILQKAVREAGSLAGKFYATSKEAVL